MTVRHARLRALALIIVALVACEAKSAPAARSDHGKASQDGTGPVPSKSPAPPAPQPQPSAATASGAPEPMPAAPSSASEKRVFAGTTLDEDSILEQLASAPIFGLHAVGSTSTVFKATLKSPIGAALKAATLRRPSGPLAEVAAYRLARLLGLHNVPPAILRSVSLAELRAHLAGDDASKWTAIEASLVADTTKHVLCAAILWIDGLRDLGLEKKEARAELEASLRVENPLRDQDRERAAQGSTLLAFDYLIGNWDRWSGGNLKGDASGHILYMRDHDAAFASRLSEPLHRRILDPLVRVERFSRSFYGALRTLDRAAFRHELERDPNFVPSSAFETLAVDAVFERRETLLSHIAATIEERGEANVLVFP